MSGGFRLCELLYSPRKSDSIMSVQNSVLVAALALSEDSLWDLLRPETPELKQADVLTNTFLQHSMRTRRIPCIVGDNDAPVLAPSLYKGAEWARCLRLTSISPGRSVEQALEITRFLIKLFSSCLKILGIPHSLLC